MTDYFIGDCHFGHRRIIEFCPVSRPFASIEEHDQTLIDNWNTAVKDEDIVYILGDFFLGGYNKTDRIKEILDTLHGTKILIQGNHDLDKSASHWKRLGFDKVLPMAIYRGCLLTHIPVDKGEIRGESHRGRFIANLHAHLHDEGNTPELNLTGRFCVSAEQVNLTPISWEALWQRICDGTKKYLPLEGAAMVVYTGENAVDLGEYSASGKRMKGQTFRVDSKTTYTVGITDLPEGLIHIVTRTKLDDYVGAFVKSKNFVGVSR